MNNTIDKILHLAGCIRQDIGHIRNGANVTPEELWSANESLDELFKVAVQAKKACEPEQIPVQKLTDHDTNLRPLHKCKEMNKFGGCRLHNFHCGFPRCNQ